LLALLWAIFSYLIYLPLITISRRLMVTAGKTGPDRKYDGSVDCLFKILENEGIEGFYNGWRLYMWKLYPLFI